MQESVEKKLREAGIPLDRLKIGENQIRCPQCSHLRKKKHIRCLSVRVDHDGFAAFCHHCGWKGGAKDRPGGAGVAYRGARPKPGDFGAARRRKRYDVFS